MKKLLFKSTALLMAGIILFASCSSATLIESNPSGAKLYLNGEYAGTTPYTYSDTRIVGSSVSVRLEKEGYETLNTGFSRNEDLDAGALIGGLFVWIPLLWIMKYKPTHTYELRPLGQAFMDNNDTQQRVVTDAAGNEYISYVLK